MTKFINCLDEVYDAEKVEITTIRTVEVIVTLDVSDWDDSDGPISDEELLTEETDQWLAATGWTNEHFIKIEGLSVDFERITVVE